MKMNTSWLRHMQAFHSVIETGSTTAAAKRLYVTQPAISNLISKLEGYVGFKLFERVGTGLVPTQEAIYLHEDVKSIMHRIEVLPSTIQDIRDMRVGRIRLAIFPGASLTFMPELLSEFRLLNPGIKISMQTHISVSLQRWRSDPPFDLGLTELPQLYGDVDVEEFEMRCVCVLPAGHRLAALSSIRPEDLAGEEMISLFDSHMTSYKLERVFQEAGVERNVSIEVSFFAIACNLVQRGAGVAIVDPINGSHSNGMGLVVRPFEPRISMQIGMLFPTNKPKARAVESFASQLRNRLMAVSSN